jgi:hypothetical protein
LSTIFAAAEAASEVSISGTPGAAVGAGLLAAPFAAAFAGAFALAPVDFFAPPAAGAADVSCFFAFAIADCSVAGR